MAIWIRRSGERGATALAWLRSRHTFSFGQYYDPEHMGFASLRVLNDDWVAPGGGFSTHAHANMEIVSYVLEGELAHRDSLGNGSVIRPGDVQRMSAGTGIRHSEFNASKSRAVRFLQIWFLPERHGIEPGYEQRSFAPEAMSGQLRLVASHDGRNDSIRIHQDVAIYAGKLGLADQVIHELHQARAVWVHVARGGLALNGTELGEGDAAAVLNETSVRLEKAVDAEVLLFDMAR